MRPQSFIAAGLISVLAWYGAVGQDLLPLQRAILFNNNGRTPPTPVGGKTTGHYGWFEKWSPAQIALARDRDAEGQATVVLQDGVAGKGSVVFSQLPAVFRSDAGVPFDVVRNVIAYAYASRRSSP